MFWMTGTGLCAEPSRTATLAALAHRDRSGTTVFDLDWRPMFWKDPDEARPYYAEALAHATVAVGNLEECEIATGEREPYAAARALLAAGVELAVVKQGPKGVLAVHRDGTQAEVPPRPRRGGQRARRGRRVRRGALPRAAVRLGVGAHHAVRQRCRSHRRRAPRLLHRDAVRRRGRPGPLRRPGPAVPDPAAVAARARAGPPPGEAPATGAAVPPGAAVVSRVDIAELVGIRTRHPEAVAEAASRRRRRPRLIGESGRLMIIAADHPARGALAVGDRPLAMANRLDLLERLCLALSRPGVDGVLATADILDDLLLLGALDDKVVMGSMNRGGLAGAAFELDDRFTGHRAQDLDRLGFDAGKLLLRIDYEDPGSLDTLYATARVVDEMAERQLPVFIEPFICHRIDGQLRNDLSAEAVTRSIAIASGLAGTSAYTWLKVPVTDDPDDMAARDGDLHPARGPSRGRDRRRPARRVREMAWCAATAHRPGTGGGTLAALSGRRRRRRCGRYGRRTAVGGTEKS